MQTDTPYLRPVPAPSHESARYWEGLKERKLLLQRCSACGKLRHYPRPMCDSCHSMAYDWIEATGRGTVHSWTVTHHAFHHGFKATLPYVLATVDLEEGVRMLAQLRGVAPEAMRIGQPVRVAFEAATQDLALPYLVPEETPTDRRR